jgi:hypothetical protein
MSASSKHGCISRTAFLYKAGKESTERGLTLMPAGVIEDGDPTADSLSPDLKDPFGPAIFET